MSPKLFSELPGPGDVIGDKYELGELLGQGAMGRVVRARHLILGRDVAVKFLSGLATSVAAVERFVREAQVAQSLQTEHAVKVFDLGVMPNGLPYMVMELLEGQDLGKVLQTRGALPVSEAVDYVVQACEGAAAAHAEGIVHRDIKPSNLFLTRRRNGSPLVKVVDFGISKVLSSDHDDEDQSLTSSVALLGSPLYMSPEQIRSSKNIDHRTDVWALGVTLYSLLKADAPFRGEGIPSLCAAIVADPPEPLTANQPGIPEELWVVIQRALEKRPEDRTSSAVSLAEELAPFGSETAKVSAQRSASLYGAAIVPAAAPWTPQLAAEQTADDSLVGERPAAARSDACESKTELLPPDPRRISGTLNRANSAADIEPRPPTRRPWLLPAVGIGALLGVGAIGLFLTVGRGSDPSPLFPGEAPGAATAAAPEVAETSQPMVRPIETDEPFEDELDAGSEAGIRRIRRGNLQPKPTPVTSAAAPPPDSKNATPTPVDGDDVQIIR